MLDTEGRGVTRGLGTGGLVFVLLLGMPIVAQAQWSFGASVGLPDSDLDVALYDPPNTTADDSSPLS